MYVGSTPIGDNAINTNTKSTKMLWTCPNILVKTCSFMPLRENIEMYSDKLTN